jgi:hypothetical protein
MNNEASTQTDKPNETKFFYYEKDGKVIGPADHYLFYDLLHKNQLPHETLIWEVGTQKWVKLGERYKTENPPPLPLSHITNGFAITMAFMPFFQMRLAKYLEVLFRSELISLNDYSSTLVSCMVFLYWFIPTNILLLSDIFSLERKNIKFGWMMWIFGNIHPTYLFYRGTVIAKANGKSWHLSHFLALVWIASANYAYGLGIF